MTNKHPSAKMFSLLWLSMGPTVVSAGSIIDDFILLQDTNQVDPAIVLKGATNGVEGAVDQEWSIELNRNRAGDFTIVDNFDDATDDANTIFQIEPGALGNSLTITSGGGVGIGLAAESVFTKLALGQSDTGDSIISFLNDSAAYFLGSTTTSFQLVDVAPFDGDCDACTVPLKIDHGAPSGTIFANTLGRVGVQTFAPGGPLGSNLSVGSSGGGIVGSSVFFDNGSNNWSVGADSALGFVVAQDTTAYLAVQSGGNVGLSANTTDPEARLHVGGVDDAKVLVEDFGASLTKRALFEIRAAGNPTFNVTSTDNSLGQEVSWAFANPGTSFRLSRQGSGVVEMQVNNNGDVVIAGTLFQSSDVNEKQDISALDSGYALARVMELPIAEWSYKDAPDQRHVGPMAQDFHAAFGLGTDETTISSIDTGGVALAAIQDVKNEKDREIAELQRELREYKELAHDQAKAALAQEEKIEKLERMLGDLAARVDYSDSLATALSDPVSAP